ncbi:MAG TPA: hypothetical protein VK615_12200 [Candidatus Binatia bacterium]|nr:hypothetical protein [Candidatus Binatia bacterium]
MQQKPPYPKRPVRVVWLTFLGFAALIAISLPFQDDLPPQKWPLAFGYCALLPACAVGIARLGRPVFLFLAGLLVVPTIFGAVGVTLMMRDFSDNEWTVWLRISLYLFSALGVCALGLAARGWLLYWRHAGDER